MMTNLVSDLRSRCDGHTHTDGPCVFCLAANEIERLEKDLSAEKLLLDEKMELRHPVEPKAHPTELLAAAKAALGEMCHAVSQRNAFSQAVDRLDAAIRNAERTDEPNAIKAMACIEGDHLLCGGFVGMHDVKCACQCHAERTGAGQ